MPDPIISAEAIGSWDTSNIQDLRGMFKNCEAFNIDTSGWTFDENGRWIVETRHTVEANQPFIRAKGVEMEERKTKRLGRDRQWQEVEFRELLVGDTVRLYEADGEIVKDNMGFTTFKITGTPFKNENEIWEVSVKPFPQDVDVDAMAT